MMYNNILYDIEVIFAKEKKHFHIFLVIPKTSQTIESMWVVNFEIHLLPNCNCFRFFYNCSIPRILQLFRSLNWIWILSTHLPTHLPIHLQGCHR
jgi:hypothetical protein